MSSSALIIGGTGQLGRAAASTLVRAGWEVDIAHRGPRPDDAQLDKLGISSIRLDRDDTDTLLAQAEGRDAVVDTVAFTPYHGAQLARLSGRVGSLVVVSTGAVYEGSSGGTSEGSSDDDFPDFPVPIPEDWKTLPDGDDYGSRKAALERLLLATDGLPVSILRPGTLHGPHSASLHHWSFIKRALDGRRVVPLAYDGQSRFSTSSSVNVAALIKLCVEQPGRRVLNAVDDQALTVAEIGRKVFQTMGHDAAFVTFPGPPREHRVGFNPWGVPKPIVLDGRKAQQELGYQPAISYDDAVRMDIEWAVEAVERARAAGGDWHDVFPDVISRYGSDGWFPYAAEDAFMASLVSTFAAA